MLSLLKDFGKGNKRKFLKYKLKKEFMERKYDYHNYQYVLKQSENLKMQKKYQLIKKKK